MEIVGFAVAFLAIIAAVLIWQTSLRRQKDLEERLRKEQATSARHERSAEQAVVRMAELEAELKVAIERRDEKAMAAVLWELELERSYRQWRDVIVPGSDTRSNDINAGQQLAFAVSQEVERLREEVGVSIRFDGGLDLELKPEPALGALRISEELLALAAKEADEVVVSLDQDDQPAISIVIDCQGWDDVDNAGAGDIEKELARMASKLEGSLDWSKESDGRVRAVLNLPAA